MATRLAIIPARGGSKRFPRKNLALFQGTPLVVRAVEVAQATGLFDRVVVSTDDPEIEALVCQAAQVHDRPPHLATETARLTEVCVQVLEDYQSMALFCLLLPTSPLRTAQHVRSAHALLEGSPDASGAMSVTPWSHVPAWAVQIPIHGYLRPAFGSGWFSQARADLPTFHRHNGAVLWMRTTDFLREPTFYGSRMLPYYMWAEESVDIDTPLDIAFAEFLAARQTQ